MATISTKMTRPGLPNETRRCRACGGPAPCLRVARTSSSNVPIGTQYFHECAQCKRTFVVPDALDSLTSAFGAIVMLACGLFLASMGANQGFWLSPLMFGAVLGVIAIARAGFIAFGVFERLRSPLLAP